MALALAAQKSIENLFGGVSVIADRPVAVGDFCRFGDQVGTVEDIGLRSTRVRTLNRTLLTVPNGQFSSMTLENFSKRDKMWFHLTLNLRRDTTAGQVRQLLDCTTRALAEHPKVEVGGLPVRFVGVGTYSLDVEIFVYVLTRDYDEFLEIQQELFLWILGAVEAVGTSLALPTQATTSRGRRAAPRRVGQCRPEVLKAGGIVKSTWRATDRRRAEPHSDWKTGAFRRWRSKPEGPAFQALRLWAGALEPSVAANGNLK